MDDIFVARIMSSSVLTVSPDALVEEAARIILDNDISSVIVTDKDGHLEGILTTTDFVKIVAEQRPKDQTPVSKYMSRDIITAKPQDSIVDVANTLIEYGFHHVPVVTDDNVVIGIVSTTDLANYISEIQS